MNILLFAPGLLLLLWKRFGFSGSIPRLVVCALPQVVLAIPFLLVNPWGYIQRSFDLGRQFFFVWTVNWKFLPEEIFLSPVWGLILLSLTASTCALFYFFKWTNDERGFRKILAGIYVNQRMTSDHIITVLFTSNFIGILLARSLHFQFYVWYWFTLPYLLWSTSIPTPFRVAILFAIEVVWNIFPSNPYSSAVLQVSHLLLFIGLVATPLQSAYIECIKDKNPTKELPKKKAE
jgi:alpha-1,3-mannosyltransferase